MAVAPHVRSLDALRGALALYVVLHHMGFLFSDQWNRCGLFLYNKVFAFGHEAVIAFFILSGFAIMRSHGDFDGRAASVREYACRRIKRLYGVYLGALLVTWLLSRHRVGDASALLQLPANVLMLQAGSTAAWLQPFMGNTPLWSLSYEAAYYVMFPLLMGLGARWGNRCLVIAVLLLGLAGWLGCWMGAGSGANVLGLLPVWWLGAWLARESCPARHWGIPRWLPCFGVALVPLLSRSIPALVVRDTLVAVALLPLFVQLIQDGNEFSKGGSRWMAVMLGMLYLTGAWFLLDLSRRGLVGSRVYASVYLAAPLLAIPASPWVIRIFAKPPVMRFLLWSCGISYGVYVIHFAILQSLVDLSRFLNLAALLAVLLTWAGFFLALGAGWMLEGPFHRYWSRWFSRLSTP